MKTTIKCGTYHICCRLFREIPTILGFFLKILHKNDIKKLNLMFNFGVPKRRRARRVYPGRRRVYPGRRRVDFLAFFVAFLAFGPTKAMPGCPVLPKNRPKRQHHGLFGKSGVFCKKESKKELPDLFFQNFQNHLSLSFIDGILLYIGYMNWEVKEHIHYYYSGYWFYVIALS